DPDARALDCARECDRDGTIDGPDGYCAARRTGAFRDTLRDRSRFREYPLDDGRCHDCGGSSPRNEDQSGCPSQCCLPRGRPDGLRAARAQRAVLHEIDRGLGLRRRIARSRRGAGGDRGEGSLRELGGVPSGGLHRVDLREGECDLRATLDDRRQPGGALRARLEMKGCLPLLGLDQLAVCVGNERLLRRVCHSVTSSRYAARKRCSALPITTETDSAFTFTISAISRCLKPDSRKTSTPQSCGEGRSSTPRDSSPDSLRSSECAMVYDGSL